MKPHCSAPTRSRSLAERIGAATSALATKWCAPTCDWSSTSPAAIPAKGLALQDLIEEGNLGLLRAVEGFDPAHGYAVQYVCQLLDQAVDQTGALINSAKTIRIPAYMVELLVQVAARDRSPDRGVRSNANSRRRSLACWVCRAKKLPIIKKAIRIYNSTPQTDQAEAGWSLGEMVMDERMKSPDEELLEHDVLKHVMEMLQTMDSREATVLRMRFGLDDTEPHTLKEIGEELGLTRERVRQIETEALGKLGDGLKDPRERLIEALTGESF